MGDLIKLKLGVSFEETETEYIFDKRYAKRKKITSRLYPSLLNKNQYESVGHAILDRFNLLQRSEIDPYYSVRGEIAERLANEYIKEYYKKIYNAEIETKTWDKEEVKYDNFHHLQNYGGLIDIAITTKGHEAVVEVKSKSISKFKTIEKYKGNIEEIMQGEYLTYLSAIENCVMCYIFFSKDQENAIQDFIARDVVMGYDINEKVVATKIMRYYNWKPKQFKWLIFTNKIDKNKLAENLDKVKKLLDDFEKTGTIKKSMFVEDEIMYFDQKLGKRKETPIIRRIF